MKTSKYSNVATAFKVIFACAFLGVPSTVLFGQLSPPSTNLLVWLEADKSVLTNSTGVYEWDDQSGAANEHDALYDPSAPGAQLIQLDFTNGIHPVVDFDGASDLDLDNYEDFFNLTNYTIYIIGDVNNAYVSDDWIGSWPGFVVGISDSVPGRIKFGTQNSAGIYQDLEPGSGADLGNYVPYMVTASFVNGGEKSLYVNGNLVGTQVLSGSIGWDGSDVAVGGLGFSAASQYLVGDVAEILVYSSVDPAQQAAVQLYLEGKYFLQPGPVTITTQPQSLDVTEPNPATFQVNVDGTPPYTFQWLKNGSPILGATNQTYTILSTTTNDSGNYSVIVTNTFYNVSYYTNSQPAKLIVSAYAIAPVISSALLNYTNNTSVTVTFSESVSAQTATNVSNYKINNGITITHASAPTNTMVVLTTSPITARSILTVNGVQDDFGNTIVTNSQIVIPVPGALASAPPSANMLLWLAADKAVITNSNGVYQWGDQSTNVGDMDEHNATQAWNYAQAGQVSFPNAIHPVVSFDGNALLDLDNPEDFAVTNFSIYIVGDINSSYVSDDWIGAWPGFVVGGSDIAAGQLKFGTQNSLGAYDDLESSGVPLLANRVPYLVTASFINNGEKTFYVDEYVAGSEEYNAGIDFAGSGVGIGGLDFSGQFSQFLIGDIAEILVYASASSAQDTAVQNYLVSKYFTPSAVVPALLSATLSATDDTNVMVAFSEAVSPATATNALNYSINKGVSVSAVTWVDPTDVILTTSPINPGITYTLTVNNIADWTGGSVIAANSQVTIGVPSLHLAIAVQTNLVTLTWSNPQASLESAGSLAGPWSNVAGAISPYTVTNSGNQMFFKLEP